MSEEHGHGPSWYKLFIGAIGLLNIFMAFMVSQCSFSWSTTEALLNSALCAGYSVLTIACFGLGIFISLVGLEHAKRTHRKSQFFYLSITFFFAILAVTIVSKVI